MNSAQSSSASSSRQRRGLLVVLSSPSGAGKTTLSRMLLTAEPEIAMSVSATTRPMRPGEVEGRDYHFVDDAQFERMASDGEFAEWATVFDHRYGSPKDSIKEALKDGHDILFDIDWQGTQQLRTAFGNELVSIFLLPPSMDELERRLRARNTDDDAVIDGRMARARNEISHWAEYDYVLVNDDVDACLGKVRSIIAAERLKRFRAPGLVDFVRGLGA